MPHALDDASSLGAHHWKLIDGVGELEGERVWGNVGRACDRENHGVDGEDLDDGRIHRFALIRFAPIYAALRRRIRTGVPSRAQSGRFFPSSRRRGSPWRRLRVMSLPGIPA